MILRTTKTNIVMFPSKIAGNAGCRSDVVAALVAAEHADDGDRGRRRNGQATLPGGVRVRLPAAYALPLAVERRLHARLGLDCRVDDGRHGRRRVRGRRLVGLRRRPGPAEDGRRV